MRTFKKGAQVRIAVNVGPDTIRYCDGVVLKHNPYKMQHEDAQLFGGTVTVCLDSPIRTGDGPECAQIWSVSETCVCLVDRGDG